MKQFGVTSAEALHHSCSLRAQQNERAGLTFSGAIIGSTTSSNNFGTATGTVTATPLTAAPPHFATGLGAMGLLGWRRKRKAQAVL
jgi:hypothetical protein